MDTMGGQIRASSKELTSSVGTFLLQLAGRPSLARAAPGRPIRRVPQ